MDGRNTKVKSAFERISRTSTECQVEEKEAQGWSTEFEREQLPRSRRRNKKDDVPNAEEVRFMYEQPEEQEEREKPEDAIPDLPENQEAREFLKNAPSSGLWMPLGKEVKLMKCWRCGAYGHRTGDRDCPKFLSGSETAESFYKRHEDPMAKYLTSPSKEDKKSKKTDANKMSKEERVEYYKAILEKERRKERRREKGRKRQKRSSSSSDSSESDDLRRQRTHKKSREESEGRREGKRRRH